MGRDTFRGFLRFLPRFALVGVVYAALAALSDAFFYFDRARFLAFWLPAGFTLALLLRTPRRTWVGWLVAVFLAEALLQLVYARPFEVALAWGLANCLEPFLGASLMQAVLRRPVTLSHPRQVLVLVGLGALLPPMVSGLVAGGAAVVWAAPQSSFLSWWTSWWVGDALGVILMGPFFLTAFPRLSLSASRKAEALVLLVLLAALTQWAFSARYVPGTEAAGPTVLLGLYATFIFLVWGALRFGVPGVSTASMVLALIAGWNAGRGLGPFQVIASSTHEALVCTQAVLAVFGILSLLLASALSERHRVERAQRLLADVGGVLSESLEDTALAQVARRVVPELADACVLSLYREQDQLVPVGRAGVDASGSPLPSESASEPTSESTSESTLEPVPGPVSEPESVHAAPHVAAAAAAAAWMAGPGEGEGHERLTLALEGSERVLGQLALFRHPPRQGFTEEDRVLAEAVARRCALRVERAQLHQELEETARRAEESLAQLETLLQTAPIGFAFFDKALRCVRTNEAFLHLLGVAERDAVGHGAEVLDPRWTPLLRRALARGEPVLEREVEGGSREEAQWLLASGFPVRHGLGREPLGVGLLLLDITERKRAEEVHRRLFQEAQGTIKARDAFLSLAAHELKTPLTPLALRLEVLARRLQAAHPDAARTLEQLRAHVRRLQRLIEHVLEVAQVESGQLSIRLAPMPLDELVCSVASRYGHEGSAHELVLDTGGAEAVVLGDRLRLEEVLVTLMENAIKYSPEGGTIRVGLRVDGDEVRVWVADPGVGIPPEQQPRVFERYFRGTNAPPSAYGGLGLGLYLCRSIVESHGGRIGVQSEVGRGTTFTFALPLLRAARRPSEEAGHAPSPWVI